MISSILHMNCDNPTSNSPKSPQEIGKIIYRAADENKSMLSEREYPIYINNVLDSNKIWKKTIILDTTIYTLNNTIGLEFINDENDDDYSYHNPNVGTVCFLTSNDERLNSTSIMVTPLPKNTKNITECDSNTIQFTINVFFLGDEPIREDVNENITLIKKDGGYRYIDIPIKNPNKYLVSLSDANYILDKKEIINKNVNETKIYMLVNESILFKENLKDNYLIIHLNKLLVDNPNTQKTDYKDFSNGIFVNSKTASIVNRQKFEITNYTLVFEK